MVKCYFRSIDGTTQISRHIGYLALRSSSQTQLALNVLVRDLRFATNARTLNSTDNRGVVLMLSHTTQRYFTWTITTYPRRVMHDLDQTHSRLCADLLDWSI